MTRSFEESAENEHKLKKKQTQKRWYENNKTRVLEKTKRYRANNPDRVRAHSRRYHANRREDSRKRSKEYRTANPEKAKEAVRNYQRQYPERLLWSYAKLRAKKKGLAFEITHEDVARCVREAGSCCPITLEPFERGKGAPSPRSMSLDRVNPALGYVSGNIRIISVLANAIKQNCTDPEVFRRMALYIEESK